ncbi:MAG: WYL domain-containing protein [Candidatus Gastranaerophilaceae bacterium]
MQEFLTNNTVSCNLMSLTGYRTLIILSALMESPKSNDELNECFLNNQYIKEKFSNDTLRIYINSLRAIGCEITKANKSNTKKYELISHPFAYDITNSQLKALSKMYKNFYDKIDVREVIALENFFRKLSNLVKNESTREFLRNISLLKRIDREILNDLIMHCKNKNQITFLYNSPKSGEKEIEIVADKLSFKSDKLYLWGNNLTHKEYSYFSVERIIKICSIKFLKSGEEFPPIKVVYEVYNTEYMPKPDEKVIEKTDGKLVIEITSRNEFSVMQRILYMADDCKVLQPETFKTKLVKKLKLMEENYENI